MKNSTNHDVDVQLSIEVLVKYLQRKPLSQGMYAHEPGPPILVAAASFNGGLPSDLGHQVAEKWLLEQGMPARSLGAFGGLGGLLAGYHALSRFDAKYRPFGDVLSNMAQGTLSKVAWRTKDVGWRHYDLFQGPSGLLLGGLAHRNWMKPLMPAAMHLERLCMSPQLENLRGGPDILEPSEFNIGRINTGMAHGVAGVASALKHVIDITDESEKFDAALRRCCDWLLGEAFMSKTGLITWPPVGCEGGSRVPEQRPQAWCYGTPGVAWTLWDCGRVLRDSTLQLLGIHAMRSFCNFFDVDKHLRGPEPSDILAVCHGAAGILAVADAFARHAGLKEAHSLTRSLTRKIRCHFDEVVRMADLHIDMLNGATGIASVLLATSGGDRNWLSLLALR